MILDGSKPEYPHKNHLMETWSQQHGLYALADRAVGPVKEASPNIESWTENELVATLHGATRDLGVAQKPFMMIPMHSLSSMKTGTGVA